MSEKIAFVNVSFKEKYIEAQARLRDSILGVYPDAKLFFWSDEMPPNSKPFNESLYGFKVHAIQKAIDNGCTLIVWVDSCAILKSKIDNIFDLAKQHGVVTVQDKQHLYRYISDDFKAYTGAINKEYNLVGGSLYVFDFTNATAVSVFSEWKKLEADGYFGTQQMIMKEQNDGFDKCGHRMDETCMAYVIYKNGLRPFTDKDIRYNTKDCVILKNHFVQDGEKWYQKTRAIHEHTVDIGLFNGGVCIDVGCRGFEFSLAMQKLGLSVYAYDVDDMLPPDGIEFKRIAVLNRTGFVYTQRSEDKNATHIFHNSGSSVECMDINIIYRQFTKPIDVLKLDCEGAEYLILSDDNFQPIPKQISIEFHAHAQVELHNRLYDKCMSNLLKYYKPIKHKMTDEHCAGMNYWDSLFVRLDLL